MDAYTLPDLPYDYGDLAPHISAETMHLHHDKHHAAYVKTANQTLDRLNGAPEWQVPGLQHALSFNVSGHLLHSLFWVSLSPTMGQRPEGHLESAIKDAFGSVDAFQTRFTNVLTTIQGSGWALLVWEPLAKQLQILQVHDHQNDGLHGAVPLLAADGWEHAYYVDYRNDKAAWAGGFMAVANWAGAAERFEVATAAAAVRS